MEDQRPLFYYCILGILLFKIKLVNMKISKLICMLRSHDHSNMLICC